MSGYLPSYGAWNDDHIMDIYAIWSAEELDELSMKEAADPLNGYPFNAATWLRSGRSTTKGD